MTITDKIGCSYDACQAASYSTVPVATSHALHICLTGTRLRIPYRTVPYLYFVYIIRTVYEYCTRTTVQYDVGRIGNVQRNKYEYDYVQYRLRGSEEYE